MGRKSKDVQNVRRKGSAYSSLYLITAVVHFIYVVIFAFAGCRPLVTINVGMTAFYIVIGLVIRKVARYRNIFAICTVAMTFFLISHYLTLGPSFGFQYLCFGMVPFMYYLAYVDEAGVDIAKWGSVASYVALSVVSFIGTRMNHPGFDLTETFRRVIVAYNTTLTFFMSIQFMTEFVKKTYADAGVLEDKNNNLEKSASIDALTGLLNRRTIESYIDRSIRKARGEGSDFSVLMCDIDNFKKVNDTYGHDCGDQVLVNIANIIKSEVRPDDAVFRWGGEEIFIVVNGGEYIAKAVAERCRKAIEESSVSYNGKDISVTITIGGATHYQGASRDDLINRADKHLYEGKQNGKNQVVM